MADPKSEYADFATEHKASTILQDIIKEKGWVADDVVKRAIDKYRKLQETAALRFLNSQQDFLDKVTARTNDIEVDDLEDDKTLTAMLSASEKASKLIMLIPKLKEAVIKEQTAAERIRGGGEKGDYEE